jgi:uncharacterized protein (DUF1800 family)
MSRMSVLAITAAEAAHLYRRAAFGLPPSYLAGLVGQPRHHVVNSLLDFNPSAPVYPIVSSADSDYQQLVVIRRWWLQQMADQANPVREKLTLFWHNLLPTSYWKVPVPALLLKQNETLRNGAYGSVAGLLKAVSADPAMLIYLDNWLNKASSPNENFARELMELFTLGVDNGYVQLDVVEAARAWSGHGLDGARNYQFSSGEHDSGSKTIFGITQNWNGPELIDEILTGARAIPSSTFLARRLWEWYAGPTTDASLISVLATELRRVNLNTREFLKFMFNRDEFYSEPYRNSLVRGPIEWAVCLLRATGLSATATEVDWALADLGQCPFEPPSVSGWKQGSAWITEAAVWKKATISSHIAWLANGAGFLQPIEEMPIEVAVQTALDYFSTPSVSAATRAALESVLRANRNPNIGGSGQRANLIRAIALTPEFQLS